MNDITYDVRVYKTDVRKGQKVTSYHVRWKVGDQLRKQVFRTDAQSDSFRSSLLAAARNGEAFDVASGRPVSWQRQENAADMAWYKFACAYVDMKWRTASAKYRKDIARALTAATPPMLTTARGKPSDKDIRLALRRWGYNTKLRDTAPADVAHVLAWVAESSVQMSALASDPALARQVLTAATTCVDGTNAAASTAPRQRRPARRRPRRDHRRPGRRPAGPEHPDQEPGRQHRRPAGYYAPRDFAGDSRRASPRAASLYDKAIARGCDHPHAARILARARAHVIWRCWQDHAPYDPAARKQPPGTPPATSANRRLTKKGLTQGNSCLPAVSGRGGDRRVASPAR